MSIQLSDFACRGDCPRAGKPWPAHLSKPTCRIVAELSQHTNPVTVAVYRDILRNRMSAHVCEDKNRKDSDNAL